MFVLPPTTDIVSSTGDVRNPSHEQTSSARPASENLHKSRLMHRSKEHRCMRVSAAPFFGACQRWSAAAARQHDRTNRDHVHAADRFPDHGLVERIIEAVAPC
jgi:hypothetical protein